MGTLTLWEPRERKTFGRVRRGSIARRKPAISRPPYVTPRQIRLAPNSIHCFRSARDRPAPNTADSSRSLNYLIIIRMRTDPRTRKSVPLPAGVRAKSAYEGIRDPLMGIGPHRTSPIRAAVITVDILGLINIRFTRCTERSSRPGNRSERNHPAGLAVGRSCRWKGSDDAPAFGLLQRSTGEHLLLLVSRKNDHRG